MSRIFIKREKSFVAMAVAMNCYIDDEIVCKLKQGEEAVYDIEDDVFIFKCCPPGTAMSDTLRIDTECRDSVFISVKQGLLLPKITVADSAGQPITTDVILGHGKS